MGSCMWCDRDAGAGRHAHPECDAESERRIGNGMCERCGRSPIVDSDFDGNTCDECGRMGVEAPLVGYPPGGA